MTFGVSAMVRWSLAARLDIAVFLAVPWLEMVGTGIIRRTHRLRYCHSGDTSPPVAMAVTKKRAGLPRLAVDRPGGDQGTTAVGLRGHQHGVDHMDHAVRLVDVRNRDGRGIAFGVDDHHGIA